MNSGNTYTDTMTRLTEAGLCPSPLAPEAISIVESYLGNADGVGQLSRRLASIESAFSEQKKKGDAARCSAVSHTREIASILRRLTDSWRAKSLLRDFTFSFSDNDCAYLLSSFRRASESVRSGLSLIAGSSVSAAEAASAMRACAASASEAAYESRLAALAAYLDRNRDRAADCNSLAVRARATAAECESSAAVYLGLTRSCTAAISTLSTAIPAASAALRADDDSQSKINVISPIRAAGALSGAVTALDAINFDPD